MQHSEQISALLDGAGDAGDLAALPAIAQDPAARATWMRYQFIGDSLREGPAPVFGTPAFTARVSAALADDPPLAPPSAHVIDLTPRLRKRWSGRAAAGLATAASLAAVTFLALRTPAPSQPLTPATAELTAPASSFVATTAGTRDPDQVSALSPEEYQRRMNGYLVNFNEQRAQLGVPGVHPYVRVVGFESAREP